jgi:hypothetical protein
LPLPVAWDDSTCRVPLYCDGHRPEQDQRSGECASPRTRAGALAAAGVACLQLLAPHGGRGAKAPRARRSLPRLHSSPAEGCTDTGVAGAARGQRA